MAWFVGLLSVFLNEEEILVSRRFAAAELQTLISLLCQLLLIPVLLPFWPFQFCWQGYDGPRDADSVSDCGTSTADDSASVRTESSGHTRKNFLVEGAMGAAAKGTQKEKSDKSEVRGTEVLLLRLLFILNCWVLVIGSFALLLSPDGSTFGFFTRLAPAACFGVGVRNLWWESGGVMQWSRLELAFAGFLLAFFARGFCSGFVCLFESEIWPSRIILLFLFVCSARLFDTFIWSGIDMFLCVHQIDTQIVGWWKGPEAGRNEVVSLQIYLQVFLFLFRLVVSIFEGLPLTICYFWLFLPAFALLIKWPWSLAILVGGWLDSTLLDAAFGFLWNCCFVRGPFQRRGKLTIEFLAPGSKRVSGLGEVRGEKERRTLKKVVEMRSTFQKTVDGWCTSVGAFLHSQGVQTGSNRIFCHPDCRGAPLFSVVRPGDFLTGRPASVDWGGFTLGYLWDSFLSLSVKDTLETAFSFLYQIVLYFVLLPLVCSAPENLNSIAVGGHCEERGWKGQSFPNPENKSSELEGSGQRERVWGGAYDFEQQEGDTKEGKGKRLCSLLSVLRRLNGIFLLCSFAGMLVFCDGGLGGSSGGSSFVRLFGLLTSFVVLGICVRNVCFPSSELMKLSRLEVAVVGYLTALFLRLLYWLLVSSFDRGGNRVCLALCLAILASFLVTDQSNRCFLHFFSLLLILAFLFKFIPLMSIPIPELIPMLFNLTDTQSWVQQTRMGRSDFDHTPWSMDGMVNSVQSMSLYCTTTVTFLTHRMLVFSLICEFCLYVLCLIDLQKGGGKVLFRFFCSVTTCAWSLVMAVGDVFDLFLLDGPLRFFWHSCLKRERIPCSGQEGHGGLAQTAYVILLNGESIIHFNGWSPTPALEFGGEQLQAALSVLCVRRRKIAHFLETLSFSLLLRLAWSSLVRGGETVVEWCASLLDLLTSVLVRLCPFRQRDLNREKTGGDCRLDIGRAGRKRKNRESPKECKSGGHTAAVEPPKKSNPSEERRCAACGAQRQQGGKADKKNTEREMARPRLRSS
uniref:Transmembrane protein n=1 Tax=Chromera velia CCMP2878 TaxID=1169474 RepID=A0A0G4HS59_9ALVE|eukprot:Cvel_8180.t1-p1 / transcript=Cvel_8180.t1 / gene=Cvel_8180 / organism=Chromera_velia_CCMP2878 / gene_product=hypothetical protein / transcript_product=hypothetical protein / location=Cvel_scaffold446:3664-6726(+) / protein_length=1021 / sequence_SO=supercontig / SO=protein_coding / is_pseudo=false